MVDQLLVGTSYWWYWLGAWDPETRESAHPVYRSFFDIKLEEKQLRGSPSFVFDIQEGVFTEGNISFPISKLVFREKDAWRETKYRDEGFIFGCDPENGWGILCTPSIYDSVFNRLYFLRMADSRYFKPVFLMPPAVQFWQVTGDTVPARGQ
jgi:hypothetical protein